MPLPDITVGSHSIRDKLDCNAVRGGLCVCVHGYTLADLFVYVHVWVCEGGWRACINVSARVLACGALHVHVMCVTYMCTQHTHKIACVCPQYYLANAARSDGCSVASRQQPAAKSSARDEV